MKKYLAFLLSFIMMISLSACGSKAEAGWREQYDLGLKYVNEAKYEEAVIAFNKALEIDPKQVPVYISLIEVYTASGDARAIVQVVENAKANLENSEELQQVVQKGEEAAESLKPQNTVQRTDNGDGSYTITETDPDGNTVKQTNYDKDGNITGEFTDPVNIIRQYEAETVATERFDYMNNTYGLRCINAAGEVPMIRYHNNSDDSIFGYAVFVYSENGNPDRTIYYGPDYALDYYTVQVYNNAGERLGFITYDANGTVMNSTV